MAKKRVDKENKITIFASTVFLVFIIALAVVLTGSPNAGITGNAVNVKFYGVSNYPLNSQANKIQTDVEISQPDLKGMQAAGTVMAVARKITEAADFGNNMAAVAQKSVPTPIPTSVLDGVIAASGAITQKFLDDTVCLRKIGKDYGNLNSFKFVVVTDIGYSVCSAPYSDWNVARVRHTYYTMEGKKICSQLGAKLYSQKQMTNEFSSSTFGC